MSIPVDLAQLQDQISRFGPSALLVTASTDGPPHVASVVVTFDGDGLAMSAGNRTRANARAHPDVAIVWAGGRDHDYCLVVDATAKSSPSEELHVEPTSAVLHRLATGSRSAEPA